MEALFAELKNQIGLRRLRLRGAKALGIDSDPRSGGVEKGIGYVIYPRSGNTNPRASDEIVSVSQAYFQRWGGVQRLRGCLNE